MSFLHIAVSQYTFRSTIKCTALPTPVPPPPRPSLPGKRPLGIRIQEAIGPDEQKAAAVLRAQHLFEYSRPKAPTNGEELVISDQAWTNLQRLLESRMKEEAGRMRRAGVSRTCLIATIDQSAHHTLLSCYLEHLDASQAQLHTTLFQPAILPSRQAELEALLKLGSQRWESSTWEVALGTLDLQIGKKILVLRWDRWGPNVRPAKVDSLVGYICNVAVAPEARNAGVALALMEEAACIAEAKGLRAIYLRVYQDNAAGVALYKKAGYEVEEIEPVRVSIRGVKELKEPRHTLLMRRSLC